MSALWMIVSGAIICVISVIGLLYRKGKNLEFQIEKERADRNEYSVTMLDNVRKKAEEAKRKAKENMESPIDVTVPKDFEENK